MASIQQTCCFYCHHYHNHPHCCHYSHRQDSGMGRAGRHGDKSIALSMRTYGYMRTHSKPEFNVSVWLRVPTTGLRVIEISRLCCVFQIVHIKSFFLSKRTNDLCDIMEKCVNCLVYCITARGRWCRNILLDKCLMPNQLLGNCKLQVNCEREKPGK